MESKYMLDTTINESGKKVFCKYRNGQQYIYFLRAENGDVARVDKSWIIRNKKSILNVGVSNGNIYPIDNAKGLKELQTERSLANREWVLNLFDNFFPNGVNTVNTEYKKDGSQRWVMEDKGKVFSIAESRNMIQIQAVDNGNPVLNMSVNGTFNELNLTRYDFVGSGKILKGNDAFVPIHSDDNTYAPIHSKEEKRVRIARVVFDKKDKEYCYECGDLNVQVGDTVWVAVGQYGHETSAKVVKVEEYYEDKVPYYNLKEIIEILAE